MRSQVLLVWLNTKLMTYSYNLKCVIVLQYFFFFGEK